MSAWHTLESRGCSRNRNTGDLIQRARIGANCAVWSARMDKLPWSSRDTKRTHLARPIVALCAWSVHIHVNDAGTTATARMVSLRSDWKPSAENVDMFALDWVLSVVGKMHSGSYSITCSPTYDCLSARVWCHSVMCPSNAFAFSRV